MELDIRGTEIAVIRGYLGDLGGAEAGPDRVAGPGWEATLAAGEHRVHTWVFPRVVVRFSGDPERVKAVADRLRLLAFRGGG